jgi:acetate kinase
VRHVILVINCGSSSLKYGLFDPRSHRMTARGLVERIGDDPSVADHQAAVERALADLGVSGGSAVRSVGHRVVHGGARFTQPTIVDSDVLDALRSLVPLAPLHNPPAIAGIEAAQRLLPDVPQVAVFDTAFHASLPAAAFTYALAMDLAKAHGLRRYGFHGISCAYVSRHTAAVLHTPVTDLNMIVLHLGNGASATAIHSGRSVETSMGFTPLEGLVMGTRSGDLDPAVVVFLQRAVGLSVMRSTKCSSVAAGCAGWPETAISARCSPRVRPVIRPPRSPSTSTATGSASTWAPTMPCWAAWTPSPSPAASASMRRPCEPRPWPDWNPGESRWKTHATMRRTTVRA